MKKSVLLSLVLSSLMYGFVNPLPNSSKSIENGGTLSAIDAYQDGVGAMVVKSGRGIDNSVMNALVFKYGSEAKDNGVILGDQVILSGTAEDKLLAGKLFTGLILDIKRITTNLSTNITRTDYISQAYIGSNNYSGGLNWTPASAFEFHYFNGAENRLIYRNGANGDDIHAVARYQSTGLNNGNLGSYGLVFIRE